MVYLVLAILTTDFKETDWGALAQAFPAMLALTFFGILHVPINVPALGVSTGEDNLDVDRELIAHGVSNALSGLCGSIQNYLVYTNSLLFIRSGGNSRIAGVLLAVATTGILFAGTAIIGFIPVMVVGALIFLLGMDLLIEALYDTWGRVNYLEYLTILAIIFSMAAWDFVFGILVGIILSTFFFVVQASRKTAIRATFSGSVAKSTVRRHPFQQKFLKQVARQIYVCKLSGYMFFGTIGSVEKAIRQFLEERTFEENPIRYLVMDFTLVSGVDYSAAETFIRMRRLLDAKAIHLILCGVKDGSDVAQGLQSVGMWSDGTDEGVKNFEDLNAALEWCENDLLRVYYEKKALMTKKPREQLGIVYLQLC
jgi:SulP family sulfate permease